VVKVRAVRGLAREAGAQSAALSTGISLFMWIPQLIGCGIHMIMVWAAGTAGTNRAKRAPSGRGANTGSSALNGIGQTPVIASVIARYAASLAT
jgi:hypothetical protein